MVESGDGSSTLWAPDFDEHYHSIHGALAESMHVFLDSGLFQFEEGKDQPIAIFEMGFGTGLNAMLTQLYKGNRKIHYTSLEKYPVPEEAWSQLNYGNFVEKEGAKELFEALHQAVWNENVPLADDFILNKVEGDLLSFEPSSAFDLIYFDAFAPSSQAYLWSEEVMAKIYHWCNDGAIFTTYSAKGDVRRALLKAGFEVEKIPGPPRKREMIRAFKTGNA